MSVRIRRVGTCKKCFSQVGYDSQSKLVHVRHRKEACNGNNGPNKATLR